MNRCLRNQDGYHGETIPIREVLQAIAASAATGGWSATELTRAGSHPVWGFHRPALAGSADAPRIYISAGIHGDEPAGPLAVLNLLQSGLCSREVHWFLCPCLNPIGFELNRREDDAGVDLNRDYREPRTELVRAHLAWVEALPRFDAALLLHEDWEADGFYLYELCREAARPVAETVIEAVRQVCPVLQADEIDGFPARNGIVRPAKDPMMRPQWPEALYLFMHKTSLCCTFEASSDYPLSLRRRALVSAVTAAVGRVARKGRE